jgi:hypothetical protein
VTQDYDRWAPDIRLGGMYYRVAPLPLVREVFGTRAVRRLWRSLFADRSVVSGDPGVQNVRTDDLRWVVTRFDGGEGQQVFRPQEVGSDQQYFLSDAVDLSIPGAIRLNRQMLQLGGFVPGGGGGSAGGTWTGDLWTDIVGTSTVVGGNNRRLNAVGDIIQSPIPGSVLAAGVHQANFYAHIQNPPNILAKDFPTVDPAGSAPTNGTDHRTLDFTSGADGPTRVTSGVRSPPPGDVQVTFYLQGVNPPATGYVIITGHLVIRNGDDSATEKDVNFTLDSRTDDFTTVVTRQITYTAKAGKSYLYRIKYSSLSGTNVNASLVKLRFFSVDEELLDQRILTVSVHEDPNGADNILATADVDISAAVTSKEVASLTFTANGTDDYVMRAKRKSGEFQGPIIDKGEFGGNAAAPGVLVQPWNVEFGQGDRIWLVDNDPAGPPHFLYWDEPTKEWIGVGATGAPNGAKCIAMASSDYWEYALMDDDKVYQGRVAGTVQAYTAAFTNAVGLACAAARLWVLTESTTAGTRLWELNLDDAGVPLAVPANPVYTVGGTHAIPNPASAPKMTPNKSFVRRMAPTASGVVFFVNHGARSVLYFFDAGSETFGGQAIIPTGFRARALVHSEGITYIGGGFPATDTDGVQRMRPAIFAYDGTQRFPFEARLHRDGDPGSKVQDMELYGTDLYVLTQVDSSPKRMRLWRVSLTSPGGSFLQQEVVAEDTQDARAMAVSWRSKILVWGSGNPYVEQSDYVVAGEASLLESIYDYNLTEPKSLTSVSVNAEIPAGCSVEVQYALDPVGDTSGWVFNSAGVFTASGTILVATSSNPVPFVRLALKIILRTDDPAKTPVVRSVEARAYLEKLDKTFDIVLACVDDVAGYHTANQMRTGYERAQNIFDLVDNGAIVELEDLYSSKRPQDATTYLVVLQDPDQFFIEKGESIVKVTVSQR